MIGTHDHTGLRTVGCGSISTSSGKYITHDEAKKSKSTGRKREPSGDQTGKRRPDIGLPESAPPAARLFAGYNPHWVEPDPRGHVRLTEADVRDIRELLPTHSRQAIADIYGVGRSTIQSIVSGQSWAWVA